ncbi:hypothetical protein Esi_0104_0073 [Ectocarpus siliculosus]|uniref:Uncharacterized protein n=1 Tax=Ectocarpus siliculosus TaxID=2880 RepID=D7FH24_ECTSI|nr:hypothetical protein Esi_0104_0073 [Ectocarpus siliculosus]|eukprot:CBJ28402.1 hypothetical protein Esi_0104_0073 [Ectocarpus siliculosus]
MAIVSQTTEVVVATIASTGAANALLTPLHRWSSSRKRVAEAVEAAAAAKRRRQQQQRALFEQQQQEEDGTTTTNPWVALLRAALPQPVKKTYRTVAAVPGQLAKSGEQAAASLSAAKDNLAAAAEVVAAAPGRARGAATQALETTRAAREAITEAPGRVEELVKATQELPGRLRQAVGEGAEAVAALEEAGRKAAEAAETLPSRLPGLIETTTDDALVLAGDLAEGTALGLDAAGTALWEVTKELGGWAADSVLRPVLTPVHEYRTSTRRVQDALDEERVVALNAAGKKRSLSSAEEANVGGPEAATTAILLPPPATASETAPPPSLGEVGSAAGEQSTASDGSSSSSDRRTPVSRLAGLRGRFSSWRRRKRSIVAVAVAFDEDGDNTAGSSQGSNATTGTREAVLDPTPTVSETVLARVESRGRAAPVAGLEIAAGRSDAAAAAAAAKKSGEEAMATSTAPVRTVTDPPDTGGVGVGGRQQPTLEESSTQSSVGGATAAVAPSKEAAPQSEPGAPASAPALEDEKLTRPPLAEDGGPVSLEPRPVADTGPLEQVEEEPEGGADRRAAGGGISTAIASGTLGLKPEGSATAAAAVLADDGLMRAGVVAGASAGRARGDPKQMGDDNGSGHKAGEQDPPAIEGTATPSGLSRTSASTAVVAPPPPSVGTGAAATATKLAASSSTAASPAAGLTSDAAAEALAAEEATATSEADLDAAPSSAPTATAGPTPLPRARSTPRESGSDLPNTAPPQAVSGAGQEDREGRGSGVAKRNDKPRADAATGDESRENAPSVGPTASALKTSPEQQPPSKADTNPAAAAAAAGGGGGAGEAGQAADREGSNGSSGAWGVQPAVEFLKGWVEAAVPRKKEELKRREDAVCWERQWYPVAFASDLRRLRRRRRRWRGGDGRSVRFEMLGREYELLPPDGVADKPTSLETRAWRCRSIVAPDDGPDEEKPSRSSTVAAAEEVPVRESSGLLWAWPDTSPKGLEAAALASPASSAAGLDDDCCGGGGETASPWRRLLLRRHTAAEGGYGDGAGVEEKKGGSGGLRRRRWRRRRLEVVVVEHDVPCGYSEAVGGLLDPAHGEAVMAAAAGGGDGREEAAAWVLAAASSLSSVADSSSSSAGVFRAASGSPRGQGEVVFAPPTFVGWRFEPTPPPPPPPTAAAEAAARSEEASTPASADRDQPSPPPVPDGESPEVIKEKEAAWNAPPRGRWLRRRLSGGLGAEERRPGVGGGGRGSVRYVVVLLPVGPERTKVFARLEVAPPGRRLLDGLSLGSRRGRRGTLAKAIDDAAAAAVRRSAAGDQAQADAGRGAKSSTTHGGGESGESVSGRSSSGGKGGARLTSPAVEEWVRGAGNGGPF